MKRFRLFVIFSIFISSIIFPKVGIAESPVLNQEENLWLKSRNNTVVVYPVENAPPYSYKNSAGNPQGLAIDYLELIAEKLDIKIQYLTPRPIAQILNDVQKGKGDIIASISIDNDKGGYLVFTTEYLASPSVIVVRKDYSSKSGSNLNDFNGKKLAVVESSALESYVRINYPRVVVEEVTDNEVGLQQVVLGEVDAVAMDVASLSYFLSKQVLNSVKVVGNTGFELKPSFGIPKDMTVLQSIIEKGLTQISTKDRQVLNDKWIALPNENSEEGPLLSDITNNSMTLVIVIILFAIILIVVILHKRKRFSFPSRFSRKKNAISELQEEIEELENTSAGLIEELNEVKELEKDIKDKIKNIEQ